MNQLIWELRAVTQKHKDVQWEARITNWKCNGEPSEETHANWSRIGYGYHHLRATTARCIVRVYRKCWSTSWHLQRKIFSWWKPKMKYELWNQHIVEGQLHGPTEYLALGNWRINAMKSQSLMITRRSRNKKPILKFFWWDNTLKAKYLKDNLKYMVNVMAQHKRHGMKSSI